MGPGIGQSGYPLINLHSDKDNLYVETLLPGVDPSELEMTVQQNTLTISGERHKAETPEKVVWHRRERGAGKFLRTVELPLDVKTDEVRAEEGRTAEGDFAQGRSRQADPGGDRSVLRYVRLFLTQNVKGVTPWLRTE